VLKLQNPEHYFKREEAGNYQKIYDENIQIWISFKLCSKPPSFQISYPGNETNSLKNEM